MRARNLKPSIFKNELLAVEDPLYTVIFEGLWCAADREGRLEDRPAKLHLDINPGRGFEGTVRSLSWLADNGFILRYIVEGKKYILVLMFWKHQRPHQNEKDSSIPPPPSTTLVASESSSSDDLFLPRSENSKPDSAGDFAPRSEAEHNQGNKHFALNPSSLTPDSGILTPDCSLLRREGGVGVEDSESEVETAPAERPEFVLAPSRREKPRVSKSNGGEARGMRIPQPFAVTEDMLAWAAANTPNVDVKAATAEFEDYWRDIPGARGRKLDWIGTWRNRMRECETRVRRNGVGRETSRPLTRHEQRKKALHDA